MEIPTLYAVVLWLALSSLVGIDATNRGRSGIVWWSVTFVTGPVGIVVYLLVVLNALDDPDRPEPCPSCSAEYTGSPDRCSDCGTLLDAGQERDLARLVRSGSRTYCGNCHARVAPDADACSNCERAFRPGGSVELSDGGRDRAV